MKYAVLSKQIGQTPLECIEKYRKEKKLSLDIPLAYAGRLDPMAEGKLLILIGDECKKLKDYAGLDKEYVFEILFGFKTDTGDILGLVESFSNPKNIAIKDIKTAAKTFIGTHTFPYPRFSSKTIQGKPLHKWTLENRLSEIEIPKRESRIYRIKVKGLYTKQKDLLLEEIQNKIKTLTPVTDPEKAWGNDFRKEPILNQWKKVLEETKENEFLVAKLVATVGSGTYIRTLAEKTAEKLNTHGLAFSIVRKTIGTYTRFGNFGFWLKKF